jgi:hypothetical protein
MHGEESPVHCPCGKANQVPRRSANLSRCSFMSVDEQFIALRRKARSGLFGQRLCHLIIEGARSEDRLCQSGARDGNVEKRHRRGDWMVLPDPFQPMSRARFSSHKVGKNVEYESFLIEQPCKYGKGCADVRQMLDDMVGEDDVKTSFRQFCKFIGGFDNIQTQLCSAIHRARS